MARAKRDEAEIQATVAALPLEPSAEVIEKVKQNCLKEGVLIYRAAKWTDPLTDITEKYVSVHCTACGGEKLLDRVDFDQEEGCSWMRNPDKFGFVDPADYTTKQSGSTCICPCCGVGMEAIHVGRIKEYYKIDYRDFMTLSDVRGHLCLLAWQIIKECDKSGKVHYITRGRVGYSLIDGVCVGFRKFATGMWGQAIFVRDWSEYKAYKEEEWNKSEIFFHENTVVGTDMEKSAIDVFLSTCKKSYPFAYVKAWAKYPQIENLVRSGYSNFVEQVLDACTENRGYYYSDSYKFLVSKVREYIDVKKTKPHEMIGVEKQDLKFALSLRMDEFLLFRAAWRMQKVRLSKELLMTARAVGLTETISLLEKYNAPIVKTVQYLEKQAKKKRKKDVLINAGYLKDYWGMVKNVYDGDLPQELMYPKDLRKAHDQIMLRVKEKVDEKLNKQIEAYAKKMSAFSFTDEQLGLCIRPIGNQEELIKEGKFLHHCVARYAQSFAERKTCIFAIRKIAKPSVPFFTLEYRDGMVNQNRGLHNCARTKDVIAFEEKWLEFIKNKEIQNGKRSNENAECYAHA